MAQEHKGIEEIVARWRDIIKEKKRQIITPEETVEVKIKSMWPWVTEASEPLPDWEFRQFRYTRKRERVYEDETWRPIGEGGEWGGEDMSAEFRGSARIPEAFKGKKVALRVYFGGDGLLYVNGKPYHGLDPFRDTVVLAESAEGGEEYELYSENYIFWHAGETIHKRVEISQIVAIDEELNDIYWDLRCAYKVAVTEEVDPEARRFVMDSLQRALKEYDHYSQDRNEVKTMARKAAEVVRKEVYQSERFRRDGLMHLVGNSHLDVVFMWPYSEFIRKVGRTHATQLRLLEQYPYYIFSQSQPLMYAEMKEHFPDIYAQVKEWVNKDRWEVMGAFWVEPDCNLISGESFIRQLQFGIRFIESEFGKTPRTAWVPDVFGNMWTMPQILVQCGLKYFVTHKMTMWNDTNQWDRHVIWWEGPDGSRIFTTVPPSHFIGTMEPEHMCQHWDRYSAKTTVGESLYDYGWGDGGGGPDPEMLESVKRYKNFPGMVPTQSISNEGALDSMYDSAMQSPVPIPVYNDELYLEEHRGTFTTKGIFKKLNRRLEILLRKAEAFTCFSGQPWPAERLHKAWRKVLDNQFHDSLPGSHVNVVHTDMLEDYTEAVEIAEGVLSEAHNALAARINTAGDGQALVVFNALSFERDALVYVECESGDYAVADPSGETAPFQFTTHYETGKRTLVFPAKALPPMGCKVYRLHEGGQAPAAESPLKVTARSLENDHVRIEINDDGEIVSLVDKITGREAMDPEKRGNVFQLFEDEVGKHEAWDIVATYENLEFDISGNTTIEVVEEGPVRAAIRLTRPFRDSRIVQHIVLGRDSRRVDFETYVDWRERRKILKVRFNTAIRSRKATYDIPFGVIERATTRNNTYEEARFEVPAHLWMDLSQGDHGLSLLNDCKYGHEAVGQRLGLTLLKASTWPDPEADQGDHWFTYSLYPHEGDWRDAGTHLEALDLNDKADALLAATDAGDLPEQHAFLLVDAENVAVEALKKAEDSDHWILRVVERQGAQTDATIQVPSGIAEAFECTPLEKDDKPLDHGDHRLPFSIGPFQIKTFKLRMA